MRYLLIIFLFCFSFSHAQQQGSDKMQIFTYRLVYLPDSTNSDYKKEEDFYLQIKEGKSCFISNTHKYVMQTLRSMEASKADLGSMMSKLPSLPKPQFQSVVYKTQDTISVYDKGAGLGMKYIDPLLMNWELTEEKKMVDIYNCQKAKLSYGGRQWEAWFTNEIPVSDGPHTFHGLPGLIVQISDTQNHFNFSLIQVQSEKDYLLFYDKIFDRYKKVAKTEYFKARVNMRNNYVNTLQGNGVTFRAEYKAAIQRRIDSKKINYIELKP